VTDALSAAPEPLRFERSFTTDANYSVKVTRGLFRYLVFRPSRLIAPVIILVIFVLLAIGNSFAGDPNAATLILPGAYLLLFVLMYGLIYLRTARTMRVRIPAGSVFAIGFRDETFLLRSPQVSSEVAYTYYRSAEGRGDFVVLRARATRAASLLPAEIFTDESLAYFQGRIAELPK
jgi:hypothetical protein